MAMSRLLKKFTHTNLLLEFSEREGFILLSKAAAFAEDGDLCGENDMLSGEVNLRRLRLSKDGKQD